jgi:amino acid adenylation domain-containing protein
MSNLDERIAALSPEQREKLLAKLAAQTQGRNSEALITPRSNPGPARLSFAQQRLWLSHQMDPAQGTYNIPVGFHLNGPLDPPTLEQALAAVVRRHEVLRTRYAVADGEPRQFVEPSVSVDMRHHDLEGTEPHLRAAETLGIAAAAAVEPFDLSKAPMLRAALIRWSVSEAVLVLVVHHVACDGWSIGIVVEELFEVYASMRQGRQASLRPLPIQYADFAEWQRGRLEGAVIAEQVEYWREQLHGASMLQLATDRPRQSVRSSAGSLQTRVIAGDVIDRLDSLAKRERATQTIVVLAVFQALFARYTGQDDIVIGSALANRTVADIEPLVGCFVNMLPVRADLSGDPTFSQVIGRVREASLQAYDHQALPFEKLVEHLNPHREPGENPFFQVVLSVHNAPVADVAGGEISIEPFEIPMLVSRFDIELHVVGTGSALRVDICYAAELFDAAFISSILEGFERLLRAAVADPAARVAGVRLIDDATRRRVVEEWNDTAARYPRESGIPALVEQQAAARPAAIAIVCEGVQVTYGELNDRANRLAHYLRRHGVSRGARVGICLERGVEMVVGVLAILKSGGSYVPLDPDYPDQRLAAMLDDSRPSVVVSERRLMRPVSSGAGRTIHLDGERDAISAESGRNLELLITGDDIAYVMYTSGSTGKPKGVCVPHRAVTRLVWHANFAPLTPSDVIAQVSNSSFDAATFEMWGALVNGARLAVIARESILVPAALSAALRDHGVTAMFLTTALFNQVAREQPAAFAGVRHLLVGGDALDPSAIRRVLETAPPMRLVNGYGPTENATFSACFEAATVAEGATSIPIGRGITNSTVYVLGSNLEPVAPGVPGEIFVGGDGLAAGYLDRPALTAETFVPSPFGEGERLYRTGDLGRWMSGGYVDFMGRTDDQVKIRGFRIEPGEIVAILCQHAAVGGAAVVVDGAGAQKRLIAYVTFKESAAQADFKTVRTFLRDRLPDYMVPSAFVKLDCLPLTPNGKIDRRALPAPVDDEADSGARVAPRTDLERTVAAIWRDVLATANIGVSDNFFDVGGHSLLLVAVHARLEDELRRKIPIVALFRYPTIESLAGYLAPVASTEPAKTSKPYTAANAAPSGAIAVVGLAGRFPGAADVEAFWSNLRDGVESIRFFSDEELRESGISEELLNDSRYVKARAALDDVDKFDAAFFGYTPREAELMDPQHRLFLECAWHALENAGCDPYRYPGRIGVFAGAKANSYFLNLLSDQNALEAAGALQGVIASQADFLATKVSYKLNLRGPSVNVQSACSTSLVAVHQAWRSLLAGDCDMALAGGVTVGVPGKTGYLYQQDGIGSPDGHCRAFDAQARGTVGGDGVGVVVLKRFEDAVRDGDLIHAVILGSATNNDGSNKVGYTAPSVEGQAEVIRLAHESAGVAPETITYVEAHGTGTALGDPIEISALAQAFGMAPSNRAACAVGSLKTNVGHLDAAAGVAGLIKTVLALEHRQIPPSLHFERPNPAIDFAATPFVVSDRLQPWTPADEAPRRAGVSSFGIGGTNAHVVVEEAPIRPSSGPSRIWKILTLSARTDSALEEMTARLRTQLKRDPSIDLSDVAYTLQTGRARFDRRRAVVCKAAADALQAIDGLRAGHRITAAVRGRPTVAFLFPGQGSQFQGMGRELYDHEPVFRKTFDECADQFAAVLGVDLRVALYETPDAGAGVDSLAATSATQAALFAVELSLARLWMSFGITPAACLGHSIGEYVAACVSGVLTMADAIDLIAARGSFMDRAPQGAMLALSVAEDKARELLDEGLWLAVINGPSQCVVAGTVDAITALEGCLEREGIPAHRLQTAGAFHSGLMDGVEQALADAACAVRISSPRIPYLSNLTGDWITPTDLSDRGYWAKHTRGTVRFSEGVRRLIDSGATVFLEVGPGRVLSSLVRRQLASTTESMLIASPIQHPGEIGSEAERFAGALGQVWTSGVELDWSGYYADERRLRVEVPQYPFARERYWIARKRPAVAPAASLIKGSNVADWLYAPVWKQVPALPSRTLDSGEPAARWAVIGDGGETGAKIAAALERSGAEIVNFSASPELPGVVPQHIVIAQEDGLGGLATLVRAIARANVTQPLDIRVLSYAGFAVTGEELCEPEQAALAGLCRVVPQEHPNLRCTLIDLAAHRVPESTIDRVVEILHREPAAPVLAVRGLRQWALSFEPIGRGVQQPLPSMLKTGGVYLITGGLGRIGVTLAEHLVDTLDAAVVLVSRSESASERLTRLVNRGRVIVAQGDVADEHRMKQVIAEAEKTLGPLTGVFHTAGSTSGGGFAPIVHLDAPAYEEQFRSKVEGTRVLGRVLGTKPLDFVALFSSISTVLGGLGFGAYAAANAFMDSFADQQTRRGHAPWISIGWDGWRFDESQGTDRGSGPGAFALTPREGIAALECVLRFSANPLVIVSTADLQSRVSMLTGPAPKPVDAPSVDAPAESHARPELGSIYVEPLSDRQKAIATIWEELLGIAPVGIHDNFFELGGHSLLAVQLVFRLTRELQIDLSAHHVFDAPTVAELASLVDHLVDQRTRQAADIASVLDEVAGLSDEEVERLLAGE